MLVEKKRISQGIAQTIITWKTAENPTFQNTKSYRSFTTQSQPNNLEQNYVTPGVQSQSEAAVNAEPIGFLFVVSWNTIIFCLQSYLDVEIT